MPRMGTKLIYSSDLYQILVSSSSHFPGQETEAQTSEGTTKVLAGAELEFQPGQPSPKAYSSLPKVKQRQRSGMVEAQDVMTPDPGSGKAS